ncbi:MAG: diaminopimelate epimerase [Burkholderiaceae bacterium]|nr:diaminopimelate epimerase [Burkholderiaceae bacterium]
MKVHFTKMQGAGNDFVVLDETRGALNLTVEQYRFLADRHFGVGADQILSVRAAPSDAAPGVDFAYAIHNADGQEVEHCGNGARCFVRFVRDQGLTTKDVIKVQTMNRVLELQATPDGRVTVNMGVPQFEAGSLPFDSAGLVPQLRAQCSIFPLDLHENMPTASVNIEVNAIKLIAIVSMGNPHAVQLVDDVDTADVAHIGPLVSGHVRFPRGVNAGFMQVVSRNQIRLRVYERGAGETLACGTGACAAVVAGVRLGLLDASVQVVTRGGLLQIDWAGGTAPVMMTGPATSVFESEIDIPTSL